MDDNYGMDVDGTHHETDHQNAIVIPEKRIQISDANIRELKSAINLLAPSDNFGIDLYQETLHFISSLNHYFNTFFESLVFHLVLHENLNVQDYKPIMLI